jgi:peroxiredoxin family protein
VKTLAVIVSRGSFNNLVQVATLLMAAVGSGIAVRVFFRDEAVFKLSRDRADELDLSDGYRGHEDCARDRLRQQGLNSLPAMLREIKGAGDARLYACSSSMAICNVGRDELLDEVDEVRGLTAFLLEDVAAADRVLTF